MKLYVIILNSNESADVIQDRIPPLGDYYRINDRCYLLSSNKDNAHSIYDALVYGYQFNIVVFELRTSEGMNYWGYSNKELWKWLGDHKVE